MQLPGQLKDTTLGDLLGTLFREKADGVLELLDRRGGKHRISLGSGQIEKVESDLQGPLLGELLNINEGLKFEPGQRLGESLLARGFVTQEQLSSALRQQNLVRLEKLFSLGEANIRFRAPRPRSEDPTASPALTSADFLVGRPRHHQRGHDERHPPILRRDGALSVLGLPSSSSEREIRAAFRTLAATHHPDKHLNATPRERTRLRVLFSEISRAYHTLTG